MSTLNSQQQSISYYKDYISDELKSQLLKQGQPVSGVEGLIEVGQGGGLENTDSLQFLCDLYTQVKPELRAVLTQRQIDRQFIDQKTRACYEFNKKAGIDFLAPDYKTIIGLEDAKGRIVIGPKIKEYYKSHGANVAELPDHLKGNHVTLFGPPDSAKMAINAMNAFHRKLKEEPAVVTELLEKSTMTPKWGADDEDSKTPLRQDLTSAGYNLTQCFKGDIRVEEPHKTYELAKDKLSQPVKRFPGLALPSAFLFYNEEPMPLHLYDFALHLYSNWDNPKALSFYVPKLETEEEARYIKNMIHTAESMIQKMHPTYKMGTVRLLIVLENPRAVFRTNEIIDELYPYFAGASLGWHDFLGSTARLFKEDPNYRIPVKADPDIVIKHIKASHLLLADVVGPRGGIKIGGMYGILPFKNDLDDPSFQVTIKGFIRDVITQMKRNLDGYWVAHPDFVRIGMALVEAWKLRQQGSPQPLEDMVCALIQPEQQKEVLDFINGEDVKSLEYTSDLYARYLIAADLKESDFIPNNDPLEVRYNVFQSLQYLTDWLCGNGCVALPAQVGGESVRVMDDLATAERSRWEVWHELYHKRFSVEDFLKIVHEEMNFIRRDLSNDKKIVQVKWDERTSKWYPIALKLMVKLMTDKNPPEFATELLMPFTIESIRNSDDPWAKLMETESSKYELESYIENFNYYFEMCGSVPFAQSMASDLTTDMDKVKKLIFDFDKQEIINAASFHGNIGESKKTLDKMASNEQALVFNEEEAIKDQLKEWGEKYLSKFGIKFLISAQGKTGSEMLEALKARYENTLEQELDNARQALFEITKKRIDAHPLNSVKKKLAELVKKHKVAGVSLAISSPQNSIQSLFAGKASKEQEVTENTWFEMASLSKSVASAFALEFFKEKEISLSTPVNSLLKEYGSSFRITSQAGSPQEWGDEVQVIHLMSHCALNMHYVNGVPANESLPSIAELLPGHKNLDYKPVVAINKPGTVFQYSGGGFLVLEYLIELIAEEKIQKSTRSFLDLLNMRSFSFEQSNLKDVHYANGHFDSGEEVSGTRLMFPSVAAGAMGTAKAMTQFLQHLTQAFNSAKGSSAITHDTAVTMLYGTDKGCREFMGCQMGVGIFTIEAGPNKLALHQGANDGFRALFLHCYEGPDKGKGFSIFCNSDKKAVLFISELAQELLKELKIKGINTNKFKNTFNTANISQEQLVNLGYKQLIFDAFEPTLPEEILVKGEPDPLASYNLAVGAETISVTNQKFARAQNLLSPNLPLFDPELFGVQGKIMDSWETVRHNLAGVDVFHFKLKKPSQIHFVSVSTKYHFGNHAEFIKIEGYCEKSSSWTEIVPKLKLEGHARLQLLSENAETTFSEIKVYNYPDGGITRLGLYNTTLPSDLHSQYKKCSEAKAEPFAEKIPHTLKPLHIDYLPTEKSIAEKFQSLAPGQEYDVASSLYGGKVVSASNEHYGPAKQLISPYPPMSMFDGLETARSREPNHQEEAIIKLGKPSQVHRIELDFTYFVNNNPLEVELFGHSNDNWIPLAARTNVKGFAGNIKEFKVNLAQEIDSIKIITYPDGGLNRLRAYTKA